MSDYETMVPYVPVTDFSDDEAAQVGGRSTVDTSGLDAETAALMALTDAMRHNIDLSVRTDGKIQDRFVELHGLHPDIIADIAANLITAGSIGETVHYFTDTGSADAIVGDITPAPASYFTGLAVWCLMNASVTGGPVTINLNNLGNQSVKQGDGTTDPVAGEPQSGGIAYFVYDGTVFQHINKASSAAGLSAHTGDTGNPHVVTSTQVGLAVVDPSDANTTRNKIVSNNDIKLVNDYRLVTHLPLGGGTVTGAAIFSGALTGTGLTTLDQLDLTDQLTVNSDTLASASTVDLSLAIGNAIGITGSVNISQWGTVKAGALFQMFAVGAPLLIHNIPLNNLLTSANIQTVAGDTWILVSSGGGNWQMVSYMRKDGRALIESTLDNNFLGFQGYGVFNDVVVETAFAFQTIPWDSARTLIAVHAEVAQAGTGGVTTIDINKNGTSMLTTKLTIDSGEQGSDTAAAPAVIDLTQDNVVQNDRITYDIDGVSTVEPKGLFIRLTFSID